MMELVSVLLLPSLLLLTMVLSLGDFSLAVLLSRFLCWVGPDDVPHFVASDAYDGLEEGDV
jgi:hypothetical protein